MALAWRIAWHRAEYSTSPNAPWFNFGDASSCVPQVLTMACQYVTANWNDHAATFDGVEPYQPTFWFDDILPESFRRGIEWLAGFGELGVHLPAQASTSSLVLGAWSLNRYSRHDLSVGALTVTGGTAQSYEIYASASSEQPANDATPTLVAYYGTPYFGPFGAGSTVYCWVRAVDDLGLKTTWGASKSYTLPSFGTPPSLGINYSGPLLSYDYTVLATSSSFAAGGYNYRIDGSFVLNRSNLGVAVDIYFQYNDGAGWTSPAYYDRCGANPYTMSPTNRLRYLASPSAQYRLVAYSYGPNTLTATGSLAMSGV